MKRIIYISYVRHLVLLVLLSVGIGTASFARPVIVKGTVKNEKGFSLSKTTITVKGGTLVVFSDAQGNFSIQTEAGSTLIFSYVGMKTQEIKLNGQKTVNVVMPIDNKPYVDEVVVVGYAPDQSSTDVKKGKK